MCACVCVLRLLFSIIMVGILSMFFKCHISHACRCVVNYYNHLCFRSPRIGGPLSQSLAMIPPTMHGHEFNQPLSRVVMVRKTDQRTFSKGRRGGEPLLETVTRETVELFNGGRAERKYTSETRDIVTPKSNRFDNFI